MIKVFNWRGVLISAYVDPCPPELIGPNQGDYSSVQPPVNPEYSMSPSYRSIQSHCLSSTCHLLVGGISWIQPKRKLYTLIWVFSEGLPSHLKYVQRCPAFNLKKGIENDYENKGLFSKRRQRCRKTFR
jgi:hypothetical protein